MHASLKELQAVLSSAQILAQKAAGLAVNTQLTGLSTDSRHIQQGDLFLALRGEHFDAHDFLPKVSAAGAVAVVAERLPAGFDLPALIVPDTKLALAEIARYWRSQFSCPVIAVAGSNGKTTVKEMIASILTAQFGAEHSLSTSGNLNNEIGVPLTVLRLQEQHRCAVIELGMNHPGEIDLLAAVALPTVALVNNAQREHQEFMQSVQAVAEENGSVLLHLPENGVAVFPADDTYTDLWKNMAGASGQRRIVTFGLSKNASVYASHQPGVFGSDIQMHIAGESFPVRLSAAGIHNVMNALAAAACCHSIGVSNQNIALGLQAFQPVNGRLQLKRAQNGARIIDDTYNANPDSVRAAIDVLTQTGSDSILVLGDMGEVGSEGQAFHAEIGAYARASGVAQLLTMGSLAKHSTMAYGAHARHFDDLETLLAALDTCVSPASIVLVKGSRFMKMERVVAHLTKQQTIGNH